MRRLSGIDATFVEMETAASPMQMMAVLLLDTSTVPGGYSYERLREFLVANLHRVPPLMRRLVAVPGRVHRPVWVDVDELDWDYHLPREVSVDPLDLERLSRMAGRIAAGRLDRDRPLWQLTIVEDAQTPCVAIVAKLHHALMDGVGGMEFMAELFETDPAQPIVETPPRRAEREQPSAIEILGRAAADLPSFTVDTFRLGRNLARSARVAMSRPKVRDAPRAPAPFTAPTTPLGARLTPDRAVSLAELPFDRVRDIAHRADATVNDVLLALVAGALRTHMRNTGALPSRRMIAGVPVDIGAGIGFGNSFAFLLMRLATDIDNPRERLSVAKAESQRGKRAGNDLGIDTLNRALDTVHPTIGALFVRAYLSVLAGRVPAAFNAIVSNVVGPPVPLYLAGARLTGMFPLGPIYEGVGLNITALSREDTLEIGVVACETNCPGAQQLGSLIASGLGELDEAVPRAAHARL